MEEKVEPLQKRAMSTGGIVWVGMTAAVWITAVWMATATMACHMKEALAGSRRLVSLSPSLSNSTSQRHFLVHLAGGETGGGDSVAAWVKAEAVGMTTGDRQAVTVAEGHRWQRRRRLRVFATIACVVKRQKRVTS